MLATLNLTADNRFRRWLVRALFALLLILGVATASAAWLLSDSNRVKQLVMAAVTRVSDRAFTIDGNFEFSLGRTVAIKAGRIRWRNPPWSADDYMLEVGEFAGSIDLLSLLQQSVVIEEAVARDAVVRLQWSDAGLFNWLLVGGDATVPGAAPAQPLPVYLEAAALRDVRVSIAHPALGEPVVIDIIGAGHQEDAEHRLVVDATTVIDGETQSVNGRIGPFPELLAAGTVDFDVTVAGPLGSLAASGAFAELGALRAPNLQLRLEASDATALLSALKLPPATDGSVRFDASITTQAQAVSASARGNFGEFELQGSLAAKNLQAYEDFKLELVATGPSLRSAGSLAGYTELPDAPYQFNVNAVRSERGLELTQFTFATTGLNINGTGSAAKLPELRDLELTFTAAGTSLYTVTQLFGLPFELREAFALDATVVASEQGARDALRADFSLGSAQGFVSGELSEAADFAGSVFSWGFDSPDIRSLAEAAGLAWRVPQPVAVRASTVIDKDAIRVTGLDLQLADNTLAGSLTLERRAATGEFSGTLSGPNAAALLGPLLTDANAGRVPPLDYEAVVKGEFSGPRLGISGAKVRVGDSRFTLDGTVAAGQPLPAVDMQITAAGGSLAKLLAHLQVADIPDTQFSASTQLSVGTDVISFEALEFSGAGAEITGKLSLSGSRFQVVDFDLSAAGQNLNALFPDTPSYRPADVPFRIAVRGMFKPDNVAIRGLDAQLGEARFSLTGDIKPDGELSVRDVQLRGAGPRLSELGDFGSWGFRDVPFRLAASLTGTAADMRVDDLQLASGSNSVAGQLNYRAGSKPYVAARLTSPQLNTNELLLPATAAQSEFFFSRTPLPLGWLDVVDGELMLQLDTLIFGQRRITNLDAELRLQDGTLHAPRVSLSSVDGSLTIAATLAPAPVGHALSARLAADHLQLARNGMGANAQTATPKYSLAADLTATGESLHDFAASADGFIWALAGAGTIDDQLSLGPLIGDFVSELVSAINPFAKKQAGVAIDCEGYYLELNRGRVVTAPALVFQTGRVTIVANGKADLASERINFTFETTPRKGIGVSVNDLISPFTKVTGTLAAPRISLNAKDAAIEGGAAVATAGFSILAKSLFNRWIGKREICQKVAGKAEQIRRERDPQNVPDLEKLFAGIE